MTKRMSVITATFNSMAVLPQLAASLAAQTCADFKWIVVDGGSRDGTVEYLAAFSRNHAWCSYSSEADFGIYDAINRGVRRTCSDHYVVAGSDDVFEPDAVSRYLSCLDAAPLADVVLADVDIGSRRCGGFHPSRSWLGHQQVFGGSHSVGMLIRTSLHGQFGFYSNRFPMLADGFFLKKLLRSDQIIWVEGDFLAGRFALGGLSSSNSLQSLAEGWQIQMLTESSRALQMMVFVGKLLARLPRLLKQKT